MKTGQMLLLVREPAATSTHPLRPMILLDIYAPTHTLVTDTKQAIVREGRGEVP